MYIKTEIAELYWSSYIYPTPILVVWRCSIYAEVGLGRELGKSWTVDAVKQHRKTVLETQYLLFMTICYERNVNMYKYGHGL